MGIYGSLSNNNYSFEESAELDEIFEDTVIGESAILLELSLGSKIPKDLEMSVDDCIYSSKFKSKTKKIIEYMESQGYSEKKISREVYAWYYAIIGNTFNTNHTGYEQDMGYYFNLVNKYCTEKHKSKIIKDVEKTIPGIKKYKEQNENSKNPKDISKNLDYLKDIERNLSKLK